MSRRLNLGSWMILMCLFTGGGVQAQQGRTPQDKSQGLAPRSVASDPEMPRGGPDAGPAQNVSVPRLVKFSSTAKDQLGHSPTGVVGVTFAIYKEQEGGAALWMETQNVQRDEQGHYAVLLGATKNEGLPVELFAAAEPRWLGVQLNLPGEVEQPRVLLVSVPYALKAADAESLGGIPASAYALATTDTSTGSGASGTGASGGSAKGASGAGGAGTQLTKPRQSTAQTTGTGTTNLLAKWMDNAGTLGNSLIFDNGTNVGIGTTSPLGPLHLARAGGAPLIWQNTSGPGNVWIQSMSSDGTVLANFGNNLRVGGSIFEVVNGPLGSGTNALTVMNTGNVGIGTTNPVGPLHLAHSGGAPLTWQNTTGLGNVWIQSMSSDGTVFSSFGNNLRVGNSLFEVINGSPINGTNVMTVANTGSVGIGTTSPRSLSRLNVVTASPSAPFALFAETSVGGNAAAINGQSTSTGSIGVLGVNFGGGGLPGFLTFNIGVAGQSNNGIGVEGSVETGTAVGGRVGNAAGKLFSGLDPSGVEKFSVDSSGNVNVGASIKFPDGTTQTTSAGAGHTVTVVVSATVAAGNFNTAVASCPAGFHAIGGGVDPGNVFTMVVTSSCPVINGTPRMVIVPDGQNPAATGWHGAVLNNSASSQPMKVGAVCAPD